MNQRAKFPRISCVDVFCGLGGLTHGLIRGGVRVTVGIDVDPHCRYPYEQNNSARFVECDIRKLSVEDLLAGWEPGSLTLLAGCAPCQPFSTYSRKGRASRADTKWDLLADFGRLVVETKPDFVTMENVPQLLDHSIFASFLNRLSGYHVWHDVIECADYGVPQSRKRLVLLASKFGPIALASPLAIDEKGASTVRTAISHLKPLAAGGSDPADPLHSACRLSELNLKRIRASVVGGSWRDWDEHLVARCHQKKSGETYPSVYGRMEWDGPAPTITTQSFGYGNGRFGHPEQDRAITLREAAILQTFPDTYRFLKPAEKVRFSVLGRLIGNAVPVRIGEIVAKSLLNHLRENPTIKATFMKTTPPPQIPDDGTPWQRLDRAFRAVLSVSKEALLKEEAKQKRAKAKKKAAKNKAT